MPLHYLAGSLEERFQVDPIYRAVELKVRTLEKAADLLELELKELEGRLSALDGAGNDRGAARVRLELDQQRQKLSQTRADLEQAWAARNALIGKKS